VTLSKLAMTIALSLMLGADAAAGQTPAAPVSDPTPASQSGTMMAPMHSNANGVLSMYGMAKSGMRMDAASLNIQTMSSMADIGTPMSREGSGTSWIPDADPMYAHMFSASDDMQMTHGVIFAQFSHTATSRGADAISAPGWFMYSRTHPTSAGAQFGFRVMLTPDPLSVGGQGYPLLFQSGEQWRDRALHDFQHPHDAISELAITYSGQIGEAHSAYVYAGYPGEPALGPPAFMHRLLAYDFGAAPIGHHWEDATHVTFGVLTGGAASTKFKIEASTFTGREPNEARYNFDPATLDSRSGRGSWNPNAFVSAQISYGFITSPEAIAPDVNVRRTSASVLYTHPISSEAFWTHAWVFGQNNDTNGEHSNAFLYETEYRRGANAVFGRAEYVQKSAVDLVLPRSFGAGLYAIGAFTGGLVRDLPLGKNDSHGGLGLAITLNTKPATLTPVYGLASPISFLAFYRLRNSQTHTILPATP
jgi:hypothetical protein